MNKVSAVLTARLIRPWQIKHFDQTKYGKQLAQYQNRFQRKRCFFVGNGPSLRAEDLTRLHEAGEITFGFNRIYNIFEETPWRPSFYISQDEKMLAGCVKQVCKMEVPVKLIPVQIKWWNDIEIQGASYFNIVGQQTSDPDAFLFSDDISCQIYNSSTGMYTAAQLAAYMGFSEIYLIGVDHHFRISRNDRGEILVDNTVKDYFTDKYNEDKEHLYIPNTEHSTLTYLAMDRHCKSRGIKVMNATRGGKLEVFPRVEFEMLFQKQC